MLDNKEELNLKDLGKTTSEQYRKYSKNNK